MDWASLWSNPRETPVRRPSQGMSETGEEPGRSVLVSPMKAKHAEYLNRPRRILICGDRKWSDYEFILERVRRLPPGTRIIEGGAKGADTLARRAGHACGLVVEQYNADWKRYGRAAGPIRNLEMLHDGAPTEVWAFHDRIWASKGTADMMKIARKERVPAILFSHHSEPEVQP
jgi:hypothetical protein